MRQDVQMETPSDIRNPLFHKAKSKADERGQTLEQLVTEPIEE